ncbi:hypothetical protein Bbelb_142200 [Branchiostoma belcheri]|nr:hypothetical protein Bbelb_142200 [Branchiostoma belcheri]
MKSEGSLRGRKRCFRHVQRSCQCSILKLDQLPENQRSYSEFVRICNAVGSQLLPRKQPRDSDPVDSPEVSLARRATLRSSTNKVQAAQTQLKKSYDTATENRISKTLQAFETSSDLEHLKAWKLIRELAGKKSGVLFIQGDDRLNTWKNHFSKLLSADNPQPNSSRVPITPVFNINHNISCDPFSQNEVDLALNQMKPGKAPGLDGLPLELWKLPKARESLTVFCNQALAGHRPPEWGLAGIVPVPKKGNLTLPDNYRGISLTQVAAKVYNRLLLNRLRPVIDKLLRPNQNGFRPSRSTSAQILALRRIVEEVQNHQKEAVFIFIDFRKAFDSINRNTMFEILLAYGIPPPIVNAIKIMYEDTTATVLTPEGETDFFKIETGVLQGDPLAPFLFIITLDYALRKAVNSSDGLTLRRRQSSRYPAVVIPDLDFADDICLLEDTIRAAQSLLQRVESATQEIGLYLNSLKTKMMHLNPSDQLQALLASDGTVIELSRMSNKELYNGLPLITQTIQNRRLALAGHVVRHEEMAAKVLLWQPDVKRRRGRPCLTLKKLIEEEVGLRDQELLSAMRDRVSRPRGRPRARWEDQLFPTLGELGVRDDWRVWAENRSSWRDLCGTVAAMHQTMMPAED